MTIDQFAPRDMQILLDAIQRVSRSLRLTHLPAHLAVKARIAELIVECAESGERDIQNFIDYAHVVLAKVNGQ
jgi:hypothetical protein